MSNEHIYITSVHLQVEEAKAAPETEEVHRSFGEFTDKRDREQIQKSIYESIPPEFGYSVFTRAVLHHFLSDLSKTGPFGKYGNVSVHFTIHFDPFHHLESIGFQSAIEIVQFDARHATGDGIEKFRRDVLAEGVVVSLFLPAAEPPQPSAIELPFFLII